MTANHPTGPACGNNPNHPLTDGDRRALDGFRTFLAARAKAPTLWERLVQWQPATAAALAQHVRALPDDWPQREFGVARADAALCLPPAAQGEQYPDRRPEIAPFDEIASPESCPACTEASANCRWHEGFAQGHHDRVQAQIDAMKARPDMPLREYALWEAEVSEALDNGQAPPELPAAPSAPADRAAVLAEDLRYVLNYRGPDHEHERPGFWDTSGRPCTHCARLAVARMDLADHDAELDEAQQP